MMPRITIHLRKEEDHIKEMIRMLGEGGCPDCDDLTFNPYLGRSESEICRLLLVRSILAEYERLCERLRRREKEAKPADEGKETGAEDAGVTTHPPTRRPKRG